MAGRGQASPWIRGYPHLRDANSIHSLIVLSHLWVCPFAKFLKDTSLHPGPFPSSPTLPFSCSLLHHWLSHSALLESPSSSSMPRGYTTPGPPAPAQTSSPQSLQVSGHFKPSQSNKHGDCHGVSGRPCWSPVGLTLNLHEFDVPLEKERSVSLPLGLFLRLIRSLTFQGREDHTPKADRNTMSSLRRSSFRIKNF